MNTFYDKEGTVLNAGDVVLDGNQNNREMTVISGSPNGFLHLEAYDNKPFPKWSYSQTCLNHCLRNPILSQS